MHRLYGREGARCQYIACHYYIITGLPRQAAASATDADAQITAIVERLIPARPYFIVRYMPTSSAASRLARMSARIYLQFTVEHAIQCSQKQN